MARVNYVKSCRKDQGSCGKCGKELPAGSAYRWWKFRYGGRRVRCMDPACAPRRSDLTQSEIKGTIYDIQEELEEAISSASPEEMTNLLNEAAERVRDEVCQDLFQDKIDAILDSFPSGNPTSEELEDRMYEMESWADELEDAASQIESGIEDKLQELKDAVEEDELDQETELEEELDEPELDEDTVEELRGIAEEAVSSCPE